MKRNIYAGISKKIVGACVVVSLVLTSECIASSDDISRRKEYMEKIENALGEAADQLEGLYLESSANNVNQAIREIEEVDRLADKLEDVQGDDSQAQRMADKYPDYVRSFSGAADYLIKMKKKQGSLRDHPMKCQELDDKFSSEIGQFIQKKDPRGLEEVPRLANRYEREANSIWKEAESSQSKMNRWKDYAMRFSVSDGNWSQVTRELRTSAHEVYREFEKDFQATKKYCDNLRRGEDHPIVDKGMKELAAFSKGREQIIKELDGHLRQAAKLLYGVEKDSNDSDIKSALRKTSDIKSALGKLKYAKGKDKRANEIVDKWPRYVETFAAALKSLQNLKEWQFTVDKAPDKCQGSAEKLEDVIEQYLEKNEPKGITEIPIRANGLAIPIASAMKNAEEHTRKMGSWLREAERFSVSDGAWREVSSKFKASVKAVFNYWENAVEKANDACAEVAAGERNLAVEKAVAKLGDFKETHDNLIAQLDRDLEEAALQLKDWEDKLKKVNDRGTTLNSSVKELLKHNEEALEDLINEMCALDIEKRGDKAYNKAKDMVDAAQRKADSRYRNVIKEAENLKKDADYIVDQLDDLVVKIDGLADLEQASKQANDLFDRANNAWDLAIKTNSELDKREDQITRAALGILRGANDPLIAARIKHGVEMHKKMQKEYDCDKWEYPAGGGYADCIHFEKCTVWEFKPSRYPIGDAQEQLDRYLPDIRKDFKEHPVVKDKCDFDEGLPVLKTEMATYPRCTP